jgi:(3S)-malyl-CoA thioesterase
MSVTEMLPPRSALYLPASNPRAIEKARTLPTDMIILDLEDAVPRGLKDEARQGALDACVAGFGDRLVAIRINGPDTEYHAADLVAARSARCDFVVLPKVEDRKVAETVAEKAGKPLLAMIETPRGVLRAAAIADGFELCGLIAGTNDLCNELHVPTGPNRAGLSLALQTIVLAARAAGIWALDGVFNDLADLGGLEAQCREGRGMGFDGKTLIHPGQIDAANLAFSPSDVELEDARALIAAASGGAQRFRDRMIESMHVETAQRLIARAAERPSG